MKKYLLLALILVPSFVHAERAKPNCPIVADLKTGKYTKAKNNYRCFTSASAAKKAGFVLSNETSTPNVQIFSGFSDTITDTFYISRVPATIDYRYTGTSNFAIVSYIYPNDYQNLLINEIGAITGRTRIYKKGTYYLDVSATGSYQITVTQ